MFRILSPKTSFWLGVFLLQTRLERCVTEKVQSTMVRYSFVEIFYSILRLSSLKEVR